MSREYEAYRIAPRLELLKMGVMVTVDTSDTDGTVIVLIDTPVDHELTGEDERGLPKLRVYLNDGELYENPKLEIK